MGNQGLAGCRVLVVEDEVLLAMMIEDTLKEAGCVILGPTGKLSTALELIRDEKPDAVVLDMSVRDGKTFAAAEELMARGIPFVISTGYSDRSLPENLRQTHRLPKPYSPAALTAAVKSLCEEVSAKAHAA